MSEEKRRINLHGTVKVKNHYKDYKIYPKSWQYRLSGGAILLVIVSVLVAINPKEHMRRAMQSFFDLIGLPGMILICLVSPS